MSVLECRVLQHGTGTGTGSRCARASSVCEWYLDTTGVRRGRQLLLLPGGTLVKRVIHMSRCLGKVGQNVYTYATVVQNHLMGSRGPVCHCSVSPFLPFSLSLFLLLSPSVPKRFLSSLPPPPPAAGRARSALKLKRVPCGLCRRSLLRVALAAEVECTKDE